MDHSGLFWAKCAHTGRGCDADHGGDARGGSQVRECGRQWRIHRDLPRGHDPAMVSPWFPRFPRFPGFPVIFCFPRGLSLPSVLILTSYIQIKTPGDL